MKAVEIKINSCILCGICHSICPVAAITVDKSDRTWFIDHTKCILCDECTLQCPKDALFYDDILEDFSLRQIPPLKPSKKKLRMLKGK